MKEICRGRCANVCVCASCTIQMWKLQLAVAHWQVCNHPNIRCNHRRRHCQQFIKMIEELVHKNQGTRNFREAAVAHRAAPEAEPGSEDAAPRAPNPEARRFDYASCSGRGLEAERRQCKTAERQSHFRSCEILHESWILAQSFGPLSGLGGCEGAGSPQLGWRSELWCG